MRHAEFAKHNDGDFSTLQILPIADLLVGREQQLKPCRFGLRERLSIRNPVPAALDRFCDLMTRKHPGYAARRTVVKENAHWAP